MKTATEIREARRTSGVGAEWRLYRLSAPLDGHSYVIVSAVYVKTFGLFKDPGPETYIFPSDSNGEISDWLELEGSFKGGMDHHEEALSNAGYQVVTS